MAKAVLQNTASPQSQLSLAATEETSDNGYRFKECVRGVTTAIVLAILWIGLVLLITVYHKPELFESSTSLNENNTESSIGNSIQPIETCSPEMYTGTICRDALQEQQGCHVKSHSGNGIFVPSDRDQQQIEGQVHQLVAGLLFLQPSPECQEAVLPLVCFYFFGLCDSSEQLQLPSSEQCETVRSETCAREWEEAISFLGSGKLPECELLPSASTECAGSGSESESTPSSVLQNESGRHDQNDSSDPPVRCQNGFYRDEEANVCKPLCNGWEYFPHALEISIIALLIISAVAGTMAATVVLIASCIRHKQMLKFPSVLIVYQTANLLVYDIIILIGRTDPKMLFCKSKDLLVSSTSPTPYCTLTGILFPYLFGQLILWWFCHIALLFLGIKFPFKARHLEGTGKNKYIHIAVFLMGLVLPIVPAALAGTIGRPTIVRYPSVICAATTSGVSFYSIILPSGTLLVAGSSFLVLIFWTLSKGLKKLSRHQRRVIEGKVLFNVTYVIVNCLVLLLAFGISYSQNPSERSKQVISYFLCESSGIRPGRTCDRSGINSAIPIQVLFDFAFILLALLPVVNLTYAINIKELKQKWKGRCMKQNTSVTDMTMTSRAKSVSTSSLLNKR